MRILPQKSINVDVETQLRNHLLGYAASPGPTMLEFTSEEREDDNPKHVDEEVARWMI